MDRKEARASREDEKQREEVVRRVEGTEMAEGLNSITKVRGFPNLLSSSFNLLLLLHPSSTRADVSFRENTSFPPPL